LLTHGSRTPRCLIATIGHTLKVKQVTIGHRPLGDGASGVSRTCPCVAEAPSEAEGEVEGASIAVAGRGRPVLHQKKLAFLHCHIFLWIDGANVIRARADQPVIVELFDNVRGPSADS
jgi:hypothetical protein